MENKETNNNNYGMSEEELDKAQLYTIYAVIGIFVIVIFSLSYFLFIKDMRKETTNELDYTRYWVSNNYGENADIYEEVGENSYKITIQTIEQLDRLPLTKSTIQGTINDKNELITEDGQKYYVVYNEKEIVKENNLEQVEWDGSLEPYDSDVQDGTE